MGREGISIKPREISELNEKVIAAKQMTQFGGYGIIEFDETEPDTRVVYRYYEGTKAGKRRVSTVRYTRNSRAYFIADNHRQHLEDFIRTDIGGR